MGCDIHLNVEVRDSASPHGVPPAGWMHVVGEVSEREYQAGRRSYFRARRYALFAALGGVRDEYGIDPIMPARGLPKDATPASRARSGEHSKSWLTLAQLKAYEWKQLIEPEGDEEAFVLADHCGDFCTRVIPQLRLWVPKGGTADDVRIVFGFDS